METNQIEKFDPSKLMDGVKDRIRSTFVSLIPDKAWEDMIEREIYIFTEGRITKEYDYKTGTYVDKRIPYKGGKYGSSDEEISPLEQMIRAEIKEKFVSGIKETMSSPEYEGYWSECCAPKISGIVRETLAKNAESAFVSFMGSIMQNALDNARNQILYHLQSDGSYR